MRLAVLSRPPAAAVDRRPARCRAPSSSASSAGSVKRRASSPSAAAGRRRRSCAMFLTRLNAVGQRVETRRSRANSAQRLAASAARRAAARRPSARAQRPRDIRRTSKPRCSSTIAQPLRAGTSCSATASSVVAGRATADSRPRARVDEPPERRPRVDAGQLAAGRRRICSDALRRAAQPVRIARAGRPLAGREQADDRVELVGQRDRRPRRPPPRRAARASAARRPRRRPAGSGSRSPSTPPRAALLRARRCRPSCPAAR